MAPKNLLKGAKSGQLVEWRSALQRKPRKIARKSDNYSPPEKTDRPQSPDLRGFCAINLSSGSRDKSGWLGD